MGTVETEKFIITNIEYKYVQSNELATTPKPPTRVGVKSLISKCKRCGHSWHASSYGSGKLEQTLGHVGIECPNSACSNFERVRAKVLF
ncbi:hypothetical protein V1U69_13440 [Vibrio alginolyticus]|uniref:hypothetical protein n=1 Tax=Vibrio alginolyticus TaxID=663 RepID=UPI002990F2F8|nr:hypothetical protein [Vibrio parahaemolyticus]